jgi:hypothetical protein
MPGRSWPTTVMAREVIAALCHRIARRRAEEE